MLKHLELLLLSNVNMLSGILLVIIQIVTFYFFLARPKTTTFWLPNFAESIFYNFFILGVIEAQKLKQQENIESGDDTDSLPEPEGAAKVWVAATPFSKRRSKKKSKGIEPERSSTDQRHTPDPSEYIKTSHEVYEEMGQNTTINRFNTDFSILENINVK